MTILMAAIGIGFLIFIHELGHFLCARMIGVHVEVFSLGFGQRLCGVYWKGTDYRLSLVPFGGYVRVAGDDPTQRTGLRPDDLQSKSVSARAWFFSGGVIMNLAFALIVFPLVFSHGVEFYSPTVGAVRAGSPAWEAGLEPGDRIVTLNGQPMYDFHNLVVEIALASDEDVTLEIERGDTIFPVVVRPRYNESRGIYQIGIEQALSPEHLPIRSVDSDSPAYVAGMRTDDRIVAVQGEPTDGPAAVRALTVRNLEVGAPLRVTVQRGEDEREFTFTPGTQRDERARVGITAASRVVAGMRPDVPIVERLGLRHRDVVVTIDGQQFLGEPVESDAADITLEVLRDGKRLTLSEPATAADREALFENVAFELDRKSVVLIPLEDSPAERAGIRRGDRLLRIDSRQITHWDDVIDVIGDAGSRQLTFHLERGDERLAIVVTPEHEDFVDLGFLPETHPLTRVYQVDTFGGALKAGMVASVDLIQQIYVMLRRIFRGEVSAKNLGGIVSISHASYRFAERGWAVFLYFLGLLSINLAFVNVLPIPVLDGGHLMFLLIEKVKGSPVSTQVLTYSQVLGLVFVIALMLFVTYNDILRLL